MNGNLIGDGHLEDCFCAYPVDFTPWLTVGDNVLAIYAYDGFHDGPADRLLEAVLFDTNAVVLPEPAASLLVAGGFTVLALSRRRRATILAEATPAACAALREPARRGRAPRRAHSALHDGSSK